MSYCILNNQIIEKSQAMLPATDRATRFGDGLFETIRVHHSTPYLWNEHITRLTQGLVSFKITFDTSLLLTSSLELIQKNAHSEGILRIMITRGSGSIGYSPTTVCQSNCLIEYTPLPQPNSTPYSLWHSTIQHAIPNACFPSGLKSNNAMPYVLSLLEAQEKQCQQALITNLDNTISETSSANIFWVKNNVIYTPSTACNIINGTIRQRLLKISPYKIIEGEFDLADPAEAEEVFITNNGLLIHPVEKILPENYHYNCNKNNITKQLTQLLTSDIQNYAIT